MSLAPGSKLGPYEVLDPIGAGGMGEVYRARDTRLGREVAIKVSPERFSDRFEREAHAIASLNHPNVCTLYDVGPNYLVMELVDGPELTARIQQGALPLDEALGIARQIAEALEAAHEKGIVHRDLKPGNIKIKADGAVKVLDFGLAKLSEPAAPEGHPDHSPTLTLEHATRVGQILGTAAYMAPEQARGGIVDQRADIWAFGVVLYEMLAGKRLFKGNTVSDTLAAVLTKEPDWGGLPAATPPRIRKLLARCLDRDRKQRLQAIGEARIAIDAPEPDARPLPTAARRGPLAAAAVALALALIAGVGWWRASRPAPLSPLLSLGLEFGPDMKAERPPGGSFLALSPDGTLLALTVRGADGATRLATRRLDDNRITTLAGTEDATSPVFSPDGQWIAFDSDRKIKKISVRGGAAVTLCDAPGAIAASWGDDGNLIAALGWGTGLSRIPSAGGAPTTVTELNREKREARHGWPQVLPGSQAVLFITSHSEQDFADGDVEVVSLKSGTRTTLHHGASFARYLPSGHLVWIHQGALYAAPFDLGRLALTGDPQPVLEDIHNGPDTGGDFAYSQTGVVVYSSGKDEVQRSIFWLDSSGGTRPLQPAPGLYGFPHFSPDGKRLAFSLGDGHGHQDIWVRDLERDTASRVTVLPGQSDWPVWTPDGKNLVFRALNGAAAGIYLIAADGSGVAQRLAEGQTGLASPQAISRDGKRLALVQAAAGGGVEIWTAPIEGDGSHPRLGKPQPFLQTPFVTILPAFSPDGRWLAYYSGEPGKEGLWVAPFPGPGGGWLVSSHGSDAIWSRGAHGAGGALFFLEDSHILMVADYTTDGAAFVPGKPRVWSPHRLLDLGSPPVRSYDLAPDGKRFAVILNADGTADPKPIANLAILVNFFDELRRRVPAGK
ncbi:MAG: protein kinase [Acidobacteriia bacterium]|nr:protein kinase [Terriglobia bacterium]